MSTTPQPRRFVRTFQGRFSNLVECRVKRQTIRKTPKRMPRPGDTIDCREWTGKPYRSKQRNLHEGTITRVSWIMIGQHEIRTEAATMRETRHLERMNRFAQADGFTDWRDMRKWFEETHGLPFEGILIQWDP